MTKPVVVEVQAEVEIDDATTLSATMGATTVAKFRQAIQDLWTLLSANPAIGAKVPRTAYRQFPMTGHPYYVIYQEEQDRIVVYVFAHARRRPGYWKNRLRNP